MQKLLKTKIMAFMIVLGLFMIPTITNAEVLPQPKTYGEYTNQSGKFTNWPPSPAGEYGGYYYSHVMRGYSGYAVFLFENANYCPNKNINISGLVQLDVNSPHENVKNIEVFRGSDKLNCTFSKLSVNNYKYNCTGRGSGALKYVINYSDSGASDLKIKLQNNIPMSCDLDQGDIINNNNQNTQSIINNNNINTQNIINSNKELQNSITSDKKPDIDFSVVGWLKPNTLDSLVTLPLNLLNTINSAFAGACNPYDLPFFNGTSLKIPCVGDYIATTPLNTVYSTLDVFLAVILIYKILMELYKFVDKITSLNSDDSLGGVI